LLSRSITGLRLFGKRAAERAAETLPVIFTRGSLTHLRVWAEAVSAEICTHQGANVYCEVHGYVVLDWIPEGFTYCCAFDLLKVGSCGAFGICIFNACLVC
jgi:hypothetical protein